jgi:FkbM family methyltransferase
LYKLIKFIINVVYKYYYDFRIIFFLNKINKKYEIKKILDIGAHHGKMTEIFLSTFSSVEKIICFEPNIKSYKFLKNRFRSSNLIKVKNYAISNFTGSKNLFISEVEDGQSTLLQIDYNSFWFKIKKIFMFTSKIYSSKQEVTVKKIDDIIIENFDFIKIDTEGNELNVLKSAKNNLNNIKFIFLEIHHVKMFKKYNKEMIYSYLKKKGFIRIKKFYFPFMQFTDEVYINRRLLS